MTQLSGDTSETESSMKFIVARTNFTQTELKDSPLTTVEDGGMQLTPCLVEAKIIIPSS